MSSERSLRSATGFGLQAPVATINTFGSSFTLSAPAYKQATSVGYQNMPRLNEVWPEQRAPNLGFACGFVTGLLPRQAPNQGGVS